jgi:hypothetical protein
MGSPIAGIFLSAASFAGISIVASSLTLGSSVGLVGLQAGLDMVELFKDPIGALWDFAAGVVDTGTADALDIDQKGGGLPLGAVRNLIFGNSGSGNSGSKSPGGNSTIVDPNTQAVLRALLKNGASFKLDGQSYSIVRSSRNGRMKRPPQNTNVTKQLLSRLSRVETVLMDKD